MARHASQRYYHGGPAGRSRGAYLLPPSITGAPSSSDFGAEAVHRRDRVYLTIDYRAALLFAAGSRFGVVYEVEPIGPIEPDPDCDTPGLSFECERARIRRIIKPRPDHIAAARMALLAP